MFERWKTMPEGEPVPAPPAELPPTDSDPVQQHALSLLAYRRALERLQAGAGAPLSPDAS